MLGAQQDFKGIKDSYTVFVCGHDRFKKGLPIYHIDKIVRETGEVFDDGSHIVYFNCKYEGDDAFGKLAHDFYSKKSKDMFYEPLAYGVKHFKETKKGAEAMCESVERYAKKQAEKGRIDTLVQAVSGIMQEFSVSVDRALDILKVKDDDRIIINQKLKM